MKLDNKLLVMSQGVSTDEADKLNTIFKVVNGFRFTFDFKALEQEVGIIVGESVNNFPVNFTVSGLWQIDKKTTAKELIYVEARIIDSKHNQMGELMTSEVQIEPQSDNFWVHMVARSLPVKASGYYYFEIFLKQNDTELCRNSYRYSVTLEDAKGDGQ